MGAGRPRPGSADGLGGLARTRGVGVDDSERPGHVRIHSHASLRDAKQMDAATSEGPSAPPGPLTPTSCPQRARKGGRPRSTAVRPGPCNSSRAEASAQVKAILDAQA
ncbi:hypothetical protein GCM10010228_55640 [Streptomyces massasporeus]|nr:hypothetical protein GCM10010228_55640 [Streptomyces massasporeus]